MRKLSRKSLRYTEVNLYIQLLSVLLVYIILSLILTRNILVNREALFLSYPWGRVSDLELFKETFLSPYLWNQHFRISTPYIFHPLNYQNLFFIVFKTMNADIYSMLYSELIFILTMAAFSMFCLIYASLMHYYSNSSKKTILFSSFLSGLYYMTSYFIYSQSMRLHILFAYALFPAIILVTMLSIRYRKFIRFSVINGILITIVGVNAPRYVALTLLVVIGLYLLYAMILRNKSVFKEIIVSIFITFMVVLCLDISPFLLTFSKVLSGSKSITPPLYETIVTRYNFYPLLNIVGLLDFRTQSFLGIINKQIFLPINYAVLIIGVLNLLFNRNRKIILYYFAILIWTISVFFLIYRDLILLCIKLRLPVVPYLLDNPRMLEQLVFTSLAIMLGFSVYTILNIVHKMKINSKLYKSLIAIILILTIVINGITFWKEGNLVFYKKVQIPKAFKCANIFLLNTLKHGNEETSCERIVWVPEYYGSYQPSWSFKLPVDAFPEHYFKGPTLLCIDNELRHVCLYLFSFRHMDSLIMNSPKTLSRYSSLLQIKYLGVHKDIHLYRIKIAEDLLNRSNDWHNIYSSNIIDIFVNKQYRSNIFFISNRCMAIYGGLYLLSSILYYDYFYPFNESAILMDFDYEDIKNNFNLSCLAYVFLTSRKNIVNDMLPYFINKEKHLIIPTRYTVEEPSSWNIGYITDPHHASWHSFLASIGSSKWEFDYSSDYGFIFSRGDAKLNIPIYIEKDNKYLIFARILKCPKCGELRVSINNVSEIINAKEDTRAEFVWVKVGEAYLAKSKYILRIENIKGSNAINIFILIPKKEYYKIRKEIEKMFQNKTVIYVLESESDFYYSNAKTIKDYNASNGELLVFYKNGKAWQDIEIVKNGTYRIALRGIGEFKMKIGNKSFILKLNSLNFTYSPPFNLTKGRYRIEIIPLNVKNLLKNPSFEKVFAGLPEGWNIGNTKDFKISFDKGYDGKYSLRVSTTTTKPKTWSWISAEVSVKPNREYLVIVHVKIKNANRTHVAISGYFENEKRWKRLATILSSKEGTGTYNWKTIFSIIRIPENVTKIRIVLNAGWVLNKSRGEAITWFDDIEVIPLDEAPKLDVVWLYSSDKTLKELFEVKEKSAKIINYTKVNPTLWIVKIKAIKPFMLSFAESYDSLWEARIYKNGKLVEKVRPIPLYSVINGFWIDKTGNLTIIIRYVPQDWFELGLKISATTFALCVFYLVWDWRRSRGNRWALLIERALSRAVAKALRV